jgi:hypothetical protein
MVLKPIAADMDWQGAELLERQVRDREERTYLLQDALALKPGMVVANIGVGIYYVF